MKSEHFSCTKLPLTACWTHGLTAHSVITTSKRDLCVQIPLKPMFYTNFWQSFSGLNFIHIYMTLYIYDIHDDFVMSVAGVVIKLKTVKLFTWNSEYLKGSCIFYHYSIKLLYWAFHCWRKQFSDIYIYIYIYIYKH